MIVEFFTSDLEDVRTSYVTNTYHCVTLHFIFLFSKKNNGIFIIYNIFKNFKNLIVKKKIYNVKCL